MTAGTPNCSAMREEAMPMTPWCQRPLARTIGSPGATPVSSACASCQIAVSMLWRWRFSSHSSEAIEEASRSSVHMRSCAAL